MVKFGGPMPWTGHLAQPENMLIFAQHAESVGYDWVTAGEHLFYPKELRTPHPRTSGLPVDPAADSYEIFTLFAWLAGQTTTLRFMSSMLLVPYRSPFVTAKLIAGLDRLSGGRFTLGAAAGWMVEEFDALNLDFASRGRITDEYLALIRTILESDGPFSGEFYSMPESWIEPKPVQRPVPIVIGGTAVAPVINRVAKHGSGWWPYPMSADQIAAAMPRMRQAWKEAGREDEPLEIHTFGKVTVDPDSGRIMTSRSDVQQQIDSNMKAGVTHMTMVFCELGGEAGHTDMQAVLDASSWFAGDVMPEFAG